MILLSFSVYSLCKIIVLFILLLAFIAKKIVSGETSKILVDQNDIDIIDTAFSDRIKIDSIVSIALVDSIPDYEIDYGTLGLGFWSNKNVAGVRKVKGVYKLKNGGEATFYVENQLKDLFLKIETEDKLYFINYSDESRTNNLFDRILSTSDWEEA